MHPQLPLGGLLLVLSIAGSHFLATENTLHEIDLEQYPLARCLDGSPGAFYLWTASSQSSSRKWHAWHNGGAWCSMNVPDTEDYMVDSCYWRASSNLGSSGPEFYPRNASVGWTIWGEDEETMVRDPVANPLMHDWNMVSLVYCDGGSFSGRNMTVETERGRQLYFRGNYILEAVIDTLIKKHGLSQASDLVVGGDSAGGLATYLHIDKWAAAVPSSVFVAALPDGGFFLDWLATKPSGAVNTYSFELRSIFHVFNATAGVNRACVAAYSSAGGDPANCFFAENVVTFIRTPLFALQSVTDSWQLENELGNTTDASLVNGYREILTSRILGSLLSHPGRGGFFDSCLHHCGLWATIKVGQTRMADAFTEWYTSARSSWERGTDEGDAKVWWQAREFPCSDCCGQTSESDLKPSQAALPEAQVVIV